MLTTRILDALVARRRALSILMLAIMAGLVIADFAKTGGYKRFPWDGMGGFAAAYGLISCILIIVISKALGYALLYRKEDYYGEAQGDDDD
jgi:uncharacterized membrane protein